jgi:hypothetical protein
MKIQRNKGTKGNKGRTKESCSVRKTNKEIKWEGNTNTDGAHQ